MNIKYLTLSAPDMIWFHYHGDKKTDQPCVNMPQIMDKSIITGVIIAVDLDNDEIYEKYLDIKERGHILEECNEFDGLKELDPKKQAIITMMVKEQ